MSVRLLFRCGWKLTGGPTQPDRFVLHAAEPTDDTPDVDNGVWDGAQPPSGSLEVAVTNSDQAELFEVGRFYYLTVEAGPMAPVPEPENVDELTVPPAEIPPVDEQPVEEPAA